MTDQDRRSGITLRELEVLQRLVEGGTAMNAARDLGISQSAVSRRLAQLEQRLGMTLFDRAGGRLVATVDALSINEQLQPVFDTLDRIARRSDAARQAHDGTLSIVAPPTIAHRFLPPHVAAFSKVNPDVQIVFDVLASDALMTGIAESRFDVGLTDTQAVHDGIRSETLVSTAAVCLLPAGHALAGRDTIRPEDLAGQDFIALTRRHSSRAAVDRLFDREGIPRRMALEASTNVSIVEFVRAGLGVSVCNPFPIVDQLGPGVVARPFLPEIPCRANFLFASTRSPSAAARAFTFFVRERMKAFGGATTS